MCAAQLCLVGTKSLSRSLDSGQLLHEKKFSFSSCIFACSLSLTSSWKSTGVSLAFEGVSRLIQTYNLKLDILLLAVA